MLIHDRSINTPCTIHTPCTIFMIARINNAIRAHAVLDLTFLINGTNVHN